MVCEVIKLDGTTMIACRPRERARRCRCGAAAHLLCDWKTSEGKTCDKAICTAHAQEVGPDKHLCPEHQLAWLEWQAARAREPELEL